VSPIDVMMKDVLIKESLLKKFYLEKMINKNWNKMTPEEVLLCQNKMEEIISSRNRRHANFVQIPTTYRKERVGLLDVGRRARCRHSFGVSTVGERG